MTPKTADEAYAADLEAWRAEAEAALRAPESWLSIIGLYWLDEGEHAMGSDPTCAVPLPAGSAPALTARLAVRGGEPRIVEAAPELLVNGERPPARPLHGPGGAADRITVGRLVMHVHRAGARVGLRVRDPASPARAAFPGRRWYPPRPEYRVTGRFERYDAPRPTSAMTTVGEAEGRAVLGELAFTLDGHDLRLEVWDGARPWAVFRDATSGVTTYGAGRFLYPEIAPDGGAVLDFNRVICPYCAFTPFATCPLPPPRNRLALPIPAGELDPGWLEH